jgi:hypothetical protein
VKQVKIQTDSSDCSQQMNTVVGYQDEIVILPTPSTQWLACITAAQTQQYYNFGTGRTGANPASLKLKPPGFFGGSGIQAETDQCQSFCEGIKTAGLFIDPYGAGYQSQFLLEQWNGMQIYKQNMDQYAGSIDPTSLISINYYFDGPIFAQLAYNITIRDHLPLTRPNLVAAANNFDMDPGSGAEIHWHDAAIHSAWNCGYVYEVKNAGGYKWVFPQDKNAKVCTS